MLKQVDTGTGRILSPAWAAELRLHTIQMVLCCSILSLGIGSFTWIPNLRLISRKIQTDANREPRQMETEYWDRWNRELR